MKKSKTVLYEYFDGGIKVFAENKPEYIDNGQALVPISVAEEFGMIRKWRATQTGWVLK
jgi:hypothetical protein